jgi:hypothetical protein
MALRQIAFGFDCLDPSDIWNNSSREGQNREKVKMFIRGAKANWQTCKLVGGTRANAKLQRY